MTGIDITTTIAVETGIWAIFMIVMTLTAVTLRRRSVPRSSTPIHDDREFFDKIHQSVRRGNSGL